MMKIHERRYTRMLRSSTRDAWRPPRTASGVIRAATPGGRRSITAFGSETLTDTSDHQPACERAAPCQIADEDQGAEVGEVPEVGPGHLSQCQVPAESDTVVQRSRVGDGLQPCR